MFDEFDEVLAVPRTDGSDQSPAFSQLVDQGLWNPGRCRCNDDSVVGGFWWVTLCTVADDHANAGDPCTGEVLPRQVGEAFETFDGDDRCSEPARSAAW